MKTTTSESAAFPRGDRAPAEYFTGAAWLQPLVPDSRMFNVVIGHVTFEAGARNNWHTHPGGQILLVTAGKGYYQEKGKPIQVIQRGDVIQIPADVVHWHGASHDQPMTHIAISTNTEKGIVVWLQRVTDEEYNRSN
ncbi:MAG: cupin domain-containing protein [Bacteroidetes bacterium]|nr:cupin domain-containing protein [Bacteroidota bacterium]